MLHVKEPDANAVPAGLCKQDVLQRLAAVFLSGTLALLISPGFS